MSPPKKKIQKPCMNPSCSKVFTAGHYGDRQKVCRRKECKKWYKMYWKQTRKPPRGMPDDIFRKIVGAPGKDERRKGLLVVARYSALRKGELLGLIWSDVLDHNDICKPAVNIVRQWDDKKGLKALKTGDSSVAFFLQPARDAIQRIASTVKPEPQKRVFPYWESKVYKWFVTIQQRLRIVNPETGNPYRFHDLRHTGIREQADQNGIEMANRFARHKKMDTTKIYTERPVEDTVSIMEQALSRQNRPKGGLRGPGNLP